MLQFYRANKSVTGAACSFSFNSKGEALYLEIIKQTGWNDKSATGSFKDGDRAVVKFSLSEVGGILNACERLLPFAHPHRSETHFTQIKIAPFYSKPEGDERPKLRGLGFSIVKKNNENSEDVQKFSIGLSPEDITLVREFLKFALDHIFSAMYAEDKKRRAEALEKKEQKDKKPQETKKVDTKKAEPTSKKVAEVESSSDDPFASSAEEKEASKPDEDIF